jgi:hypothetical protein
VRLRALVFVAHVAGVASSGGVASAQVKCAPDPKLTEPPRAPEAQAEPVSALGLVDPNARFAYVRAVLDADARHARVWTAAWAITGVALIGGNAAYAAITTDTAMRVDAIISAVKSLFIPAVLLVQPIRAMRDARLVDDIGAAFELSPGRVASCVPLSRAEELLVDAAEDEALATRWVAQIVVIGGNVAVGAVQAFGLGHWLGAAIGTFGGIAVGELQILTHPTGALDALGPYSKGQPGKEPSPVAWSVAPFAAPPLGPLPAPAAWGASVRASF